jgi:hypothetical protein
MQGDKMSIKPKKYDEDEGNKGYGTSHYIGQLNQLYSKQYASNTASWDEMDDEIKFEMVVKSLFVIRELDDSSVNKVMEALRSIFERDMSFIESLLKFMQEEELLSKRAGKISLTDEGKDVLE